MNTERKQSATEAADWRVIDDYVARQGLPREVTDALGRIRDPQMRAQAEKDFEGEQRAAASSAKEAKAHEAKSSARDKD